MTKCQHERTYFLKQPWPTGEAVEVCRGCGKSRLHYEFGQSGWALIENIEATSRELQRKIDKIASQSKRRRWFARLRGWVKNRRYRK